MSLNHTALAASFTPKQAEFVEQKKLQGTFHPKKLVRTLSKVAHYDKLLDDKRSTLSLISNIMIGVAVVCGFLIGIIFGDALGSRFFYVLYAAVATVVAGVGMKVYVRRLKASDLNNHVRNFVLPVAAIFQEEVNPDCRFVVNILADEGVQKKYLVRVSPRVGYGRGIKYYKHPWFSGRLPLADGALLSFEMEKHIQVIKIKKRGSSGKTKFKTKIKSRDVGIVKLQLPKNMYRVTGKGNAAVRIQEQEDSIVLKTKYVKKMADVEDPDVMPFLKAIHTLYANAKPVTP